MKRMNPDESVLTTAQVAQLFKVDPKTVSRWARDGKLPVAFRTIGGDRRYREADIRALMVAER